MKGSSKLLFEMSLTNNFYEATGTVKLDLFLTVLTVMISMLDFTVMKVNSCYESCYCKIFMD